VGSKEQPPEEKRIPLAFAFIAIGLLVVATAAVIYVVLPVAPPPLPEFIVRAWSPQPSGAPAALPTVMVRDGGVDPGDMFRPARFLAGGLPTEARADDAPTVLYAPAAGRPARVQIPALDVDAPIREVTLERFQEEGQTLFRWQVPNEYAAGWHNDSAALGRRGNTVLNGHHNVHGAIFGDLLSLPVGGDIYLYDEDGNPYHYQVSEQILVPERDESIALRRANAHWMERKPDERITIVTCWPRTDNTHRLIVVAHPAES
jgi:LPXTG-site transpeptidase (sortase) family protein